MTENNKPQPEKQRIEVSNEINEPLCWINPGERLRVGMTCPRCHRAKLDYNGLLQLTCPACGLTEAGACT